MKLLDISDVSLSKIFDCLTKDKRYTARFARTNYRILKIAENQGCFKVNAEEVMIEYRKDKNLLKLYAVTESVPDYQHVVTVYQSLLQRLRLLAEQYLKKLKSIAELTLTSFTITDELLRLLRDVLKPFTSSAKLKKLALHCCEFDCSEMLLFDTLTYLRITELCLIFCNLNNLRIASMHLTQISYIGVYNHTLYNCDIDDQFLTNWLYKTPSVVHLENFNTNITMNGLLKFIQKLSTKPTFDITPTRRDYYLGQAKLDDTSKKCLALAQRNPAITWEIRPSEMPNLTLYRITLASNGEEFVFYARTQISSKITKQQARDKIEVLRAEIAEKIVLDPNYEVDADEEVVDRIQDLHAGIYPEWTDLEEDIFRLETMGNVFEHGSDSEEDEDFED